MQEKYVGEYHQVSHFILRRNLGILGITLPFVLILGNVFLFGDLELKRSISHYYYTSMGIYFTGVLWSFGMFLFAYKGFKIEGDETVSDNLATNIAGIFAIVTALVPTEMCFGNACNFNEIAVNQHENMAFGYVHLGCAGAFLFIMGWMSIFKFTKTKSDLRYKRQKRVTYFVCGIMVWVSIAFMIVSLIPAFGMVGSSAVFIAETVALIFFGTAWLAKSDALDKLMAICIAWVHKKSVEDILTAS